MLVTFRRRRAQALTLLALSLAMVASLVVAPGLAANAANPPPNPTNGQISNAQQQKENLAVQVGRLNARVAQQQNQLNQLKAAQEMAEQKLAYALAKLQDAKDASARAAKAVKAATARADAAQRQYQSSVAATYMSGDIGGTTGSLLTAEDPNVVLEHSALEAYEASHQLDAVSNLKSATVAKSNADAAARRAVRNQKSATVVATNAKKDADAAVVSALAQQKLLEASLAANQAALGRAQEQLATLNHQRAAYLAYQAHQRELAREAAIRRAAAIKAAQAAKLAAEQAAARAAAAEAKKHRTDGSGSSVSSGGGGGGSSPAPHPSGGSWTATKGADAVHRAMQYLGWMYAWAGGNASGPTYGVCAGDGAFNDCHVRGFDCSGLALYAWAPSISLDHYAMAQYHQAGSEHPSISDLRLGDLLFWSSNGAVSGIHHVAIYVGGGNVIQAPESGSVIQITPVDEVSWGYFGATRPLT